MTPGPEWINTPRVGGRSGFAPLHQAAWHGADRDVVARLLELGAWRSMRAINGNLPIDIAREREHHHLEELLAPADLDQFAERSRRGRETYLHALIIVRTGTGGLTGPFRLPQIGPIMELDTGQHMWCPIPGMYGGFRVSHDGDDIVTDSWSRMADGSEQAHRITANEVRLIS